MYIFHAHYTHIYTCEEIIRSIKFDGQFFADERECWFYATGKAFDLCGEKECFEGIELIAC